MTERHLARISGISQPHVHNILKGVRDLTSGTADRFLHCLSWTILDLLEDVEFAAIIRHRPHPQDAERELMVLAHRIGPGVPWPGEQSPYERLTLTLESVRGCWKPVAARLAADPDMSGAFEAGEMAIVDYNTEFEDHTDPESLYLVIYRSEARVRWVRQGRRGIYLLAVRDLDHPEQWQLTDPSETVIEARLRLVSSLQPPDVPRRPPGIAIAPVRRSVAS